MKIIKKNQIIIYFAVLILMVAGYLNYTSYTEKQVALETAMQMDAKDDTQVADIGDATLVNSNDVAKDDTSNMTTNSNVEEENSNTNEIKDEKETDQTQETSSDSKVDYFVQSKLERDSMYSQMLETYENVLNSEHSLETQRQSATEEIEKINKTKNAIMICENLIKTKGFENSIIFVNGDSVNVIIRADELKQEEVAQIQNIVSREIQSTIENIHITNK